LKKKNELLQSGTPADRTLGARLLANSKNDHAIDFLIKAVTIDKKLYPKIEICNSLVSCGQRSIKPLIKILGQVGTNQHRKVPEKEFKNCYSTNIQSDLIRWKIIRAMSGFSESEPFLQEQKLLIHYDRL
jgi:hypothetical protein